jgi:hypothetical protein
VAVTGLAQEVMQKLDMDQHLKTILNPFRRDADSEDERRKIKNYPILSYPP